MKRRTRQAFGHLPHRFRRNRIAVHVQTGKARIRDTLRDGQGSMRRADGDHCITVGERQFQCLSLLEPAAVCPVPGRLAPVRADPVNRRAGRNRGDRNRLSHGAGIDNGYSHVNSCCVGPAAPILKLMTLS